MHASRSFNLQAVHCMPWVRKMLRPNLSSRSAIPLALATLENADQFVAVSVWDQP